MSKRVFIYGSGGHARVIADILLSQSKDVLGFIDDNPEKWGKDGSGLEAMGYEAAWKSNKSADFWVIIGIGDNEARKRVAANMEITGRARFDTALHSSAVISGRSSIGQGTVVMAGTVINGGSTIGQHVIINTGACIDHDCQIDDFVHISPGAHLGGRVLVEAGSWIGLGASIINNCRIGKNVIVGMGAVVIRDIPDSWVVAGNPARFLRMNEAS